MSKPSIILDLQRHRERLLGTYEETPWRWEPVTFREFASSKDHMNFPYLSPRQLEVADALLNLDPKKTFLLSEKKFTTALCVFGKGSGKDTLASIIMCYLIHILLCLKKPYHFLTGYDVADASLDMVNVAYNYEQAHAVFFTMFKNRVRRWKWLRSKFRIRASGKDLDPSSNRKEFLEDQSDDRITIYPSSILFPNMIRTFSRHSMTQGTEGLNCILWLMDEAASLSTGDDREKANADDLYSMLRTSAQSRFPNLWLGMILSFPRHKNDFVMKMYAECMQGKHPQIFASKGCTWEINPSKKKEDFDVELDNPQTSRDARTKYMCEPPAQEAGFIEYTDKISDCVDKERKQLVDFEVTYKVLSTGAKLLGKIIKGYNTHRQPDYKKYVAHVDLGNVKDLCALAVGHLEGKIVIIDLVTHWKPEPNYPVDVDEPAELLVRLRKELIHLHYVTYDQWNSLSSLNRLNRLGIVTDRLSLKLDDYKLLRDCIYSQAVRFPDYPLLTDPVVGELANLRLIDGIKVDHDSQHTNDISEACVGVVSMLLGTKKNVSEARSMEEFYQDNENDMQTSIWTSERESEVGDPFDGAMGGISVKLR